MKRIVPFLLAGVAALGLASLNSAAPQDPGKRPPEGRGERRGGGEEEGPLHDAMEQMNGSMRLLSRGVDASNKEKALEAVAKLQSGILTSKLLSPKDLPPTELPTYRKMMAELLAATCKLEIALLDDKFEEANRLAKEELGRMKKEGHDKYQKE